MTIEISSHHIPYICAYVHNSFFFGGGGTVYVCITDECFESARGLHEVGY